MVSVREYPRICAITCCYKFDAVLDYRQLDTSVCDVFKDFTETGEFVYPRVMTKKKSQVHVPMPFKLKNTIVFYRCRYEVYNSRNGDTRSNFLNQTCFYYVTPQKKKRCFKVFRNSLIHVTGFNDVDDMDTTTADFYKLLLQFINTNSSCVCISKQINMLNMVFKLGNKLILERINLYFQVTNKIFEVSFEPELYSGLILTGPVFKLILFRSGAVLITGTKSTETAMFAFNRLIEILNGSENLLGV